MGCLFTFVTVPFKVQKFEILMKPSLSVFPFLFVLLVYYLTNHCLIQGLVVPAPFVGKTALSSLNGLGTLVKSQLILNRRAISSFACSFSQLSDYGQVVFLRWSVVSCAVIKMRSH